jgi:hypothetical protein
VDQDTAETLDIDLCFTSKCEKETSAWSAGIFLGCFKTFKLPLSRLCKKKTLISQNRIPNALN